VNERAEAARRAVRQRLTAEDEPITLREHEKLDDALRFLYLLTREGHSDQHDANKLG